MFDIFVGVQGNSFMTQIGDASDAIGDLVALLRRTSLDADQDSCLCKLGEAMAMVDSIPDSGALAGWRIRAARAYAVCAFMSPMEWAHVKACAAAPNTVGRKNGKRRKIG